MHKIVRIISVGIALLSVWGTTGLASAHSIEQNNGYSAVMHIDPDDEPSAHAPNVLNFLISKQNGSYNQNDYNITVGVGANGKSLAKLRLEPEGFGNAADGTAHYTFPSIAAYTINLHGVSLTDVTDKFDMNFEVRVADSVVSGKSVANKTGNTATQTVLLGGLGIVLLSAVAYTAISRGKRYDPKS